MRRSLSLVACLLAACALAAPATAQEPGDPSGGAAVPEAPPVPETPAAPEADPAIPEPESADPAAPTETIDPADPQAAAPPATTTTPAPAATTTAPAGAAAAGGDDDGTALAPALVGLGVLAGLSLLVLALWAIARLFAWEPGWLPVARHALGEAGYRTGSTWSEFRDWMRLRR